MTIKKSDTDKSSQESKNEPTCSCVSLQSAMNEIENAMERWHLARDNDDETLEEINRILVGIGRLGWFNRNDRERIGARLGAVMQRLIIHSIIVLACYYICHVLLKDDGWLDIVYAICWSGNAFWLPDYTKWVTNVA